LSAESRRFPDRPNLRYLKIEAKRRLSAGEFATLHDAQLAVAREHGQPSWAALKLFLERPAFAQVSWVVSRFRTPGAAPAEDELREHFDERYLRLVPPDTMVRTLGGVADRLRADLVVVRETPTYVRARISDLRVEAAVEPSAPHRMTSLRVYPAGERVTDVRVASPPGDVSGAVPPMAVEVAEESVRDLGLPGLALAGATEDDPAGWTLVRGWADLERGEALRPGDRFPVYGVTKLVTATAVLVADGRVGLDEPAGAYLRTVRPADGTVTVRELLTHTAGVTGPHDVFADRVPEPVSVLGPVVPCDGARGVFAPSNAGYALLGQLVADVAGAPYTEAATRMVLEPLGMSRSWFPARLPDSGAVTGHRLAEDGTLAPDPVRLCVLPAAGGLWTTAADLTRFGRTWPALLPAELVREALRPQVRRQEPGAAMGLGWVLNEAKDVAGHPGGGPGAAASLIMRPGTGQATVALTNRLVPVEPVNARLARPIT
jgi:CubicO group peptidase (beta-lactamase class C family)